jgi:hypothetical protein
MRCCVSLAIICLDSCLLHQFHPNYHNHLHRRQQQLTEMPIMS